jgi:hypothetical protein
MKIKKPIVLSLLQLIGINLIIFIIIFLFINLLFYTWELYSENRGQMALSTHHNPWYDKYGPELLSKIYPDLNLTEINTLLNETYLARTKYMPFAHFSNEEVTGKYFNIHPAGFRSLGKNQATWPPPRDSINIFIFGGSTTLGVGVSDESTVASHLQAILRSKYNPHFNVYNFGVGSHFSTNERSLYEYFLTSGIIPNKVIFLDGLNDMYFYDGIPPHTKFLENSFFKLYDNTYKSWYLNLYDAVMTMPLGRVFKNFFSSNKSRLMEVQHVNENLVADPNKIQLAIGKYINNVVLSESASRAFGVDAHFIIQPVPFYKYPNYNELILDFGAEVGQHKRSFYAYPSFVKLPDTKLKGFPVTSCAEIFSNSQSRIYVDHVHYNNFGNLLLARCIADSIYIN